MKRWTAILILASLLVSCGSGSSSEQNDTSSDTSDTAETTEAVFEYEYKKTYGGEEVTILNPADVYSMRSQIDREEQNGDAFDDIMYDRARLVEEKLEVKLVEINKELNKVAETASKSVMAGDDEYSIAYIPAAWLKRMIDEDQLLNLLDIPELALDSEWWSQDYNDCYIINDELYSAVGASQLMYIDSIWALFFNEDMMTDLGLDKPYDLVREGKWTLDALAKYTKAATNLNGDESFAWKKEGSAIYGISANNMQYFLAPCGEFLLENVGQKLIFDAGNRFFDTVDALGKIAAGVSDGSTYIDPNGKTDDVSGSYINAFEVERALFLTAEIAKTSRWRGSEFAFGVVPYPKLDENQDSYYSNPFYATPGFAIPVTVEDPERSAIVGDALAYLGNEMVLPVFREVTLEQKGLRNDDSIEMLDIIIESSRPDLLWTYGLGGLNGQIDTAIKNGEAMASVIAANKTQIDAKLAEING